MDSINATQVIGSPLYWINRPYYYAYMALTKQSFGLLIITICQWWTPTLIRVSWDRSLRGQIRQGADGRLQCSFPERLVLVANHQLYTDWLYLWWIAYTNRMHGHLYIVLKEILKSIPVLGPGMMFYGFIFLARNWAKDKARFAHRLQKLNFRHDGPLAGSGSLDPMWLLLFPEGTNLSNNGRDRSAKWADKQGIPDMKHQLLPRSTGMFFCLQQVRGTLDWVYDCTVAYEGIPWVSTIPLMVFSRELTIHSRGQYGQDLFTLRTSFLQGRPPKSVNMYWRRFALSSIPLDNAEDFDVWLRQRWTEKDQFLELYMSSGRFPADKDDASYPDFIETEVQQKYWWEFTQIFVGLAAFGIVVRLFFRIYSIVFRQSVPG